MQHQIILENKSDIMRLIKFMKKNKSDYLFIHRLFDGKWGRMDKTIFDLVTNSEKFEVIDCRNNEGKNEGAILRVKPFKRF